MLTKLLPCLEWSKTYNRQTMGADLLAAIIVTIMLIPQSLAYALLAGLPAQAGLYASILPLILYAVFGSSRTLAVGPVAVISLMTAIAVAQVATPETPEYWGAAIVLAFLSGLILIAMGILKMGWIANYLSHSVISGFITASGILIAATQLKHLLGVPVQGHNLVDVSQSLLKNIDAINYYTLTLGVGALCFLVWSRTKLKPLLTRLRLSSTLVELLSKSAPVFAIIVTTGAVYTFDLAIKGVSLVGEVPMGLPDIAVPNVDASLWQSLLPAAFLISIVGFVESISVAQTLAAKRRQQINPDQELFGLGSANIGSAISSGFPVTGGFSRSIVNYDAGARTPLAGVFTAFGILSATLFLTGLFYYLPKATLGATIIVAVLTLVDFKAMRKTYAYSKRDFVAMLVTILTVLFVGVEIGILAGVSTSIILFLWKTSRPHIAVVGLLPGTEHFRNIERRSVETLPHVLSVRIDESLYFANTRYLENQIHHFVADAPEVKHVVLMCSAINDIDSSAIEGLEGLMHRLASSGIDLHLTEIKGPVMDQIASSEFVTELTGEIFTSQYDAWCKLKSAA